jgi:transposase
MRKAWTKDDDRLLAKFYGTDLTLDELAEVLERTKFSVKNRVRFLGLRTGHYWTAEQIATVQQLIGAAAGPEYGGSAIAAAVGKTTRQLYNLVKRLGISPKRWTKQLADELKQFIRARHAEQWSDQEIADGWSAEHPECPADRRWVAEVRGDQLGLPANGIGCERQRRRVAEKTREQLAAAGFNSLAELRAKAFEDYGTSHGWPGVKRPRAVQILNLLYEHGPQTRRQIADKIGLSWNPCKHKPEGFGLRGNGPGGTYTAELMRLGLVVRLGRCVRNGPNRYKQTFLYAIAPSVVRGPVTHRGNCGNERSQAS